MRYKSDFPNNAEQPSSMQYMPVTCGGFNAGLLPVNYGVVSPSGKGNIAPEQGGKGKDPVMEPSTPLPTGFPTGGTATPLIPALPGAPTAAPAQITQGIPTVPVLPGSPGQPSPLTLESPLYTPGFLRTQIGKLMRVEFLIGTNGMTDRTGTLVGVGASYILLRLVSGEIGGGNLMMCDIYSIKFVTIVDRP